jgi:Putative addiction module component
MDTTELLALPLAQRLEVMEALWDSLSRGDGAAFPSPSWHEPLLATRALALDQGAAQVSDWSEAKARVRARTGSA